MEAKSITSSKRRGVRTWISCFSILVGLPLLLFSGYCWGVWGRQSLLLQYIFQCNCPAASEETRYPAQVDVIVPACRYVNSILSPSGKMLYVQEKKAGITFTYLLDLQAEQKTSFTLEAGSNYFLTDELIFHSLYGDDEYILDITTGIKYPIQEVSYLRPSVYSMGDVDPNLLSKALLQVEQIFLIDDAFEPTIALSSDFRIHPEKSFTFDSFDFVYGETNPVEQFLQQYDLIYEKMPPRFSNEVISPDGRLVARADGIYSVETGQQILGRISSLRSWLVKGWTYDSSAVIYSHNSNPCVIRSNFGFFDSTLCFLKVPQPVLKLKVPEEYLLSNGIQ
jgi:hypothetical protein